MRMPGMPLLAAALALLAPMSMMGAKASAPPDVATQQSVMAGFSFLHGRWNGIKRSWDANGRASESPCRDIIEPMLDGILLGVHGMAFGPGAIMSGKPESQNYGIFSYDDSAGTVRIRAYANGNVQEGSGGLIAPGHAEWRLVSPIGMIRFTAKAQGRDRWIETGDISADDGKSWTKSFEIDFRRAP